FPDIAFKMFLTDSLGNPLTHLADPSFNSVPFWQGKTESWLDFNKKLPIQLQIEPHQPAAPGPQVAPRPVQPVYVVLVLDISASMSDTPLAQAKQAALDFIRHSDAHIALISFNSKVYLDQDFTRDETTLNQQIQNLKSGGGTRLYNALYRAIQLLQSKKGWRYIIALTDGETGGDDYSLEEITQLAQTGELNITAQDNAATPIFTIGFNYQSVNLQRLAEQTRAQFFYVSDRGKLAHTFKQLADSLQSDYYYTIRYRSPFPPADGTGRRVDFSCGDSLFQIHYRAPLSEIIFQLYGTVTDSASATPLPGTRIIARQQNAVNYVQTLTDSNGKYQLEVPRYMGAYTFFAEGPPGFFIAVNDTFLDLRATYYVQQNFFLSPLKKNAKLILWTIYFAHNQYQIEANSRTNLVVISQYFREHPSIQFEISGHTDSPGTAVYNQWLSERRAESVRDFFISQGVAAQNIQTIGYGETRPLSRNTKVRDHRNRRVEIRLTQVPTP
ncbi:OmpA family protein, partial [candidate division KSB1 bacterium]|nr:OmpA family protein [candidate division KSB1 bacterium]